MGGDGFKSFPHGDLREARDQRYSRGQPPTPRNHLLEPKLPQDFPGNPHGW